MTPFALLVKPVGAACNLACDYCFYLDKAKLYPDGPAVMPHAVLERMIASYLALPFDSFSITFQGGEPLVAGMDFYRRVAEIVRSNTRAGCETSIAVQTNATLVTEEAARFFAQERWLCGVSVDGPAAAHDAHRRTASGEPSYEAAVRGLRLLREAGCEFNILALITPATVGKPALVYRHLRDELGGMWQQYTDWREGISTTQWDGFLCGILDTWLADGDAGRVHVRNIDSALAYVEYGVATTCILAERCESYFVVERNGDVYPCDFSVTNQTLLGNIMTTSWEALCENPRRRMFAAAKCERHLSRLPDMEFYRRLSTFQSFNL